MNKQYRVIFNDATGTYSAVAETAKSRSKSKRNATVLAASVAATIGFNSAFAAGISPSTSSIKVGNEATTDQVAGQDATAIGNNAIASHDNSVALGSGSETIIGAQDNYQAAFLNAVQSSTGEVNIGNRTLSGVAAGQLNNDAVNVEQLKAAIDSVPSYEFTAGKNLNVKTTTDADGNSSTEYALDDDIDVNSMTAGDTKIDDNGLTIAGGPSITKDGIDAAGKKVTNVADGDITASSKDAVNGSQLYGVKQIADGNTTSITNLKNNVFTLESDGENAAKIKAGDTIDIGLADGEKNLSASKKGNTIDFSLNKNVELDSLRITNGPSLTKNGIDAAGKKITNVAAGTAGTDAVNVNQLNAIKNDVEHASQGFNVKANGDDSTKQKVAPGDSLDFSNTDGNIKVAADADGIKLDLNDDVKIKNSLEVGDVKIDGKTGKIQNITAGTDDKDAVNVSQLDKVAQGFGGGAGFKDGAYVGPTFDVGGNQYDNVDDALQALNKNIDNKLIDGGWTASDGTTDSKVKAGGKVTFAGDKNIDVSLDADNNQFNFALNPDLDVNSVDANKFTVKDSDISISKDGINAGGKKITNVANGAVTATSKDAVNGSQLYGSNKAIADHFGGESTVGPNGNVTAPSYNLHGNKYNNVGDALGGLEQQDIYLDNRINQYRDEARAGIASAMALESAPFVAGKFTYAVAGSHYGGENAVGATLRRTADNGRWSLTGGVTAASEGDPGFRVGISGVID